LLGRKKIRDELKGLGVLDVKFHFLHDKLLKEQKKVVKTIKSIDQVVESFLQSFAQLSQSKTKTVSTPRTSPPLFFFFLFIDFLLALQGKELSDFFSVQSNLEEVAKRGKELLETSDFGKLHSNSEEFFDATLEEIVLENFMGIRGKVEMDFKNMKNGVWIISGKNGAGKSTLLEGICYGLFGETLREGLAKDHLINDAAQSCQITLKFPSFAIQRTRKKSKAETLKLFKRLTTSTKSQKGKKSHSTTSQ
jgi:hypothetical protein